MGAKQVRCTMKHVSWMDFTLCVTISHVTHMYPLSSSGHISSKMIVYSISRTLSKVANCRDTGKNENEEKRELVFKEDGQG